LGFGVWGLAPQPPPPNPQSPIPNPQSPDFSLYEKFIILFYKFKKVVIIYIK